jgi:hypothetical protein
MTSLVVSAFRLKIYLLPNKVCTHGHAYNIHYSSNFVNNEDYKCTHGTHHKYTTG